MDFWVGAIVQRKFKKTWFLGTVFDMVTDEGKQFYKVQYKDGDQEELDSGEVWDNVIYHPRMDTAVYQPTELPQRQEIVLFADSQQPKIDQVEEIEDTETLPITLTLWKPSSKAKALHNARFAKSMDDKESNLIRVRPEQILLTNLQFNSEGQLDSNSQLRVRKLLRKPRAQQPTKAPPNSKHKTQPQRKLKSSPARIKKSQTPPASVPPRGKHRVKPRVSTRYNLRRR